jgi:hypothetical protein
MLEVKCFCDRCSELVTSDRTLMKLQCGPFRGQRPTVDLCAACFSEFAEWLDARPAECTAPTPRCSEHNRLTAGVAQRDQA